MTRGALGSWRGRDPSQPMGLNENQRRAVSITLRLVEERLNEIEDLLDVAQDSILRRRRPPELTLAQRTEIDALLVEVRRSVQSMAVVHGVEAEAIDSRRAISALAGLTWESLGEITAKRLRAYGEIGDEIAETFDAEVERLMRAFLELQRLVGT